MARFSSETEDLSGKVCMCSIGRVGIVATQGTIAEFNAVYWKGMGLDGRGLWATSAGKPVIVLAESLAEYIEMILARPSNLLFGQLSVKPPSKY